MSIKVKISEAIYKYAWLLESKKPMNVAFNYHISIAALGHTLLLFPKGIFLRSISTNSPAYSFNWLPNSGCEDNQEKTVGYAFF